MDFAPIKLTASKSELRRLALAAGELHGKAMNEFLTVYRRGGNNLAAVMRHYLSLLREHHLVTAAEEERLGKAADVMNRPGDPGHIARELEQLCGKLAAGEGNASPVAIMLAGIVIASGPRAEDAGPRVETDHAVVGLPRLNWGLADVAGAAAGAFGGLIYGGPAGALAGGLGCGIGASVGAVI